MAKTVNLYDAKTQLSQLVEDAAELIAKSSGPKQEAA